MGREKRELNPVEAHRRSQKRKVQEKKRSARREQLSRVPLARRDPSKLLVEIERLRRLESRDALDGPGRMRRRHLEQQFVALNKARDQVGLPSMSLPVFDPQTYAQRRSEQPTDHLEKPMGRSDEEEDGEEDDPILATIPMPADEPPLQDGVPGLPPYRHQRQEGEQDGEDNSTKMGKQRDPALPPFVIASEPVRNEESRRRLQQQVDQFLREL